MDARHALLGERDVQYRLAVTVAVAFAVSFFASVAYWRSSAAYTVGANTMGGAVLIVAPLFAVAVHYYGNSVLSTLAAALVSPVASLLARAALGTWSAVGGARREFLLTSLPTVVGLGIGVGLAAVVAGTALRRWTPPSERPPSVRFFGPPESRRRALAVIVAAAVPAAAFTLWSYATYPTYQPLAYAVFGVPVAALVYSRWRALALAWLSDAAVVFGHAAAIALVRADLDYVADPGLLVPALTTALALGTLAAAVAIALRELRAVVGRRFGTPS
ncbi:hypothetical protein MBEHAL_0969 [Halarchaeum acidiphilum MH1-52-1]|uniref:Uncharacterized protein n=1 Tax=Halarchaeum acidiphilum MH1-52-1 TaxID=1261545 RepID=U3A3I2_9EURY|nr:hypothetical protein [Halarchaeum acidiphilum]GAD52209.1 hypothetical protein MBEHAL_0969 [Halarchaeum acidiphilum MH1-52-1]